MREGCGQLAVGLGLCEQRVGLSVEGLHGVGAGSEAGGWLLERSKLHEGFRELGRIPSLLPIHALPGSDNLLGSLSVVVNGGLSVRGRVVAEQLGTEERGFDQHRADSEWGDLWQEQEFPYHRLAEIDGRVVGHILLYDRPTGDLRVPEQNIDLAHAATLEDARGTGAMRALVAGAVDWAREQGYRSFTTDWRVVNLEASRYWPRQGFRPTFYRLARAVP